MNELKIFIENLKSGDEEIRRQAIDMIGDIFAGGSYTDADINFQTGEIIEILAKQIETENWRLRKSIVESFKKINNPLCLPVLSKIMKYPQIDSHSTAIDALIHFGERSVPYAIPYLSDEDHDVRILSANILGFIKSPTALKDLIKKLNTETNINVKYAIIESLGNIGSDKAADSLLSILEYEDVYIKIAIIESLGKIGSIKACPLLMSYLEDEMLRGLCIDALGNIGADIAINSIIDYFGDDDEINSKIISAISNIFRKSLKSGEEKHNLDLIKGICRQFFKKPDRYERLLGVLKNRDVSLKSDALLILSWIDNLKLTRELVLLLENQEFRDRVREMLIKIGHSIKDDIVTEFKETESPVIKRIILEIIGIVGEEKEADFLITLLTENKSELILIEDQIIYALGWLRCDKAVSLILKYLENSSDILQSAAIGALSIIGNSEVRDYCRKNIKSDNIRKKTGCIKILGYIGDSANINILKEIDDFESKEVIISFIDAISYIGDKTGIDLIVRFLNEPDNEIKEHIVTALTRINDKKIIPILVNLLKDENMWIKYFALRTLGEIGDETIIGNILPLLKDPVGIIKIASLTAASKINYRLPKNTIEELFQSGDPDVKVETIKYCIAQNYKDCINDFIEMLENEDWRIKSTAIEAVCALGSESHTGIIMEIFSKNKSDFLICSAVFKNISNMKNKMSFEFLMENSPQKEHIETIFNSMLKYPEEFLKDYIIQFKDISEEKQLIIIKLIAASGTEMFDEFLMKSLNSVSLSVKYEILLCMDSLKRKKFLPALYPIAYPDKNIIRTAKKVLTNLKNLK